MANEIPVYLFVGFLESGKTKFIQETFEDPNFDSGDKTLLLVCEEGEEEYNQKKFAFPGVTLYNMEENGKAIPAASDIKAVKAGEGEIVTLVMCDTLEYRRYYDNKAVKKTLTIPAWLNTMAERAGLNFSQVLQNGLKNELHVQ